MKIAVASNNNQVTDHFGFCEKFIIFDTENKKIVKREIVPNPGHKRGFLPNFLGDLGVNVVIAGGMGANAINLFKSKGIEVISGTKGDSMAMVEQYLEGNLVSNNSVCHEHQHHGNCS